MRERERERERGREIEAARGGDWAREGVSMRQTGWTGGKRETTSRIGMRR